MRRLLGLAMAGLLLLSAAPAAIAAAPVAVDPSTLTPPPNPNFDWTCLALGGGIVCDGHRGWAAPSTRTSVPAVLVRRQPDPRHLHPDADGAPLA